MKPQGYNTNLSPEYYVLSILNRKKRRKIGREEERKGERETKVILAFA